MTPPLEQAALRDLTEAKAAVARHGIVMIRCIETELVPAIVLEAKRSMASSPRKMSLMDDDELDRFTERLRKTASKSASELTELYTRLLAKLGTEHVTDLAAELEGIRQLITWDRVSRSVEDVNELLQEKGFSRISLEGPEALSEAFRVELCEKWPAAFARFSSLTFAAARQLEEEEKPTSQASGVRKRRAEKKR